MKKISIFGDFFRCLIPCADKNAPAVGLRQNPDKNAMKWPKKNFIRTKNFGSGILGGCRGSFICVVVGSVQVVVVADGIASTRFVSISFLGAFRSRSLCVGYLRVVSHLRSICHTVLLMCVSSRCGSSTVSYIGY